MDLTPGEKAVLGQIRVLYATAGGRDQQLKALLMQWPPTHYDAYQKAYRSLLAKGLIEDADGQSFRITDVGLKAIGVTPRPVAPVVETRRVAQPVPARRVTPIKTKGSGLLARFVTGFLRQKA